MTSKYRKILIISGGVIASLIAILILSVDLNLYKPRIEAAASDALGMDFKIGGPLKIVLLPGFGISLEKVRIRNGGLDLLAAEKIRVSFRILPLLKREVKIADFAIIGPEITVERYKNGDYNFESPMQRTSKKEKSTSLIFTIKSLEISKGKLIFSDQITSNRMELNNMDLKIKDLSYNTGRNQSPLQGISLSGIFHCERLKTQTLEVRNIRFDIKAKDGVFDISPFTISFFGGTEKGMIKADLTGDDPLLKVQFSATNFDFEKLAESFSKKKIMKGKMNFSLDIETGGKDSDEMKRRMRGEASLRGDNLLLYGIDLDSLLSTLQESQKFSLVDAGAFLLAGPFGAALTKGYDFAGLYKAMGRRQGIIKRLVSDWKIRNGVAEAEDVAFSTQRNRVAMKGRLDFVNNRFEDVTVAVLDEKGCATFSQKISGPFQKPRIEKISTLKTIARPAINLFEKAKKLIGIGKCEVFYNGSVRHPV